MPLYFTNVIYRCLFSRTGGIFSFLYLLLHLLLIVSLIHGHRGKILARGLVTIDAVEFAYAKVILRKMGCAVECLVFTEMILAENFRNADERWVRLTQIYLRIFRVASLIYIKIKFVEFKWSNCFIVTIITRKWTKIFEGMINKTQCLFKFLQRFLFNYRGTFVGTIYCPTQNLLPK